MKEPCVERGFSPALPRLEVEKSEKMNKKWLICLFINIK